MVEVVVLDVADVSPNAASSNSSEVCADLSFCNSITFESSETYSNELSWTVTSGEVVLASAGGVNEDYYPLYGATDTVLIGSGCPVPGCMDSAADNYNPDATEDDGSCYTTVYGCTDSLGIEFDGTPIADNYNPDANTDDGSCVYSCPIGQAQVDILVTTDTYSGDENSYVLIVDGVLAESVNLLQMTSSNSYRIILYR